MEELFEGLMTGVCVIREVSGVMRMVTLIISDGNTLKSDLRQFLISSYSQSFLIATE